MKISSKTTYGLRFLLNLALSYEQDYIRLKDVAKQENISEKYLESIVAAIKPIGLVEVKRGSRGGYKLSKPPSQIFLKEIVEVLDGELIVPEVTSSKTGNTYNEQVVDDLWSDLKNSVASFLGLLTLQNLVDNYHSKNENQMYFI